MPIATIKKTPRDDRGGIRESGDDTMLHNEARELLVQGYEATHDAKGIAKAYSVSRWTVYRLAEHLVFLDESRVNTEPA